MYSHFLSQDGSKLVIICFGATLLFKTYTREKKKPSSPRLQDKENDDSPQATFISYYAPLGFQR